MAVLSADSIVSRSGAPYTAGVDGDLMVLDPLTSRYFALNGVGHRVWDLLGEPRRVGDLCAALEADFDVAPERCRADTLRFIDRLIAAGLARVA